MKKINKTLLFLTLTFVLSYSLAGLFHLTVGKLATTEGFIMAILYMFIPLLSVLIVEKILHKEKIVTSLNISFRINKWFVMGWLIFPIIGFITLGISLFFPDITYSPGMEGIFKQYENTMTPQQLEEMRASMEKIPFHPVWMTLIQGLFAGLTINAIAAFGEEIGWRGFLVKQFNQMSFFKASVIIGFIWGIWHAPLILMGHNYPEHTQIGVLMMIAWCMLLTPLFLYIRLKSKSVIASAVMHGTLNGTAGIPVLLVAGGTDLTKGITGVAGFIALAIAILVIYIYDRWVSRDHLMKGKLADSF